LSENDNNYEELNYIPIVEKLSFTNGFYVYCSVISIDIINSSNLSDTHKRPKLAKLYRSYISETIAVMRGNTSCSEVYIEGDGVIGIFNTPLKDDIDLVFDTTAQLSSIINTINYFFKKNGIQTISVGIGVSYGRTLMIKAGYKGSGINDIVWVGDVVNEASNFSKSANRNGFYNKIVVSSVFYSNLSEENKKLLTRHPIKYCYHGSFINVAMNKWLLENSN